MLFGDHNHDIMLFTQVIFYTSVFKPVIVDKNDSPSSLLLVKRHLNTSSAAAWKHWEMIVSAGFWAGAEGCCYLFSHNKQRAFINEEEQPEPQPKNAAGLLSSARHWQLNWADSSSFQHYHSAENIYCPSINSHKTACRNRIDSSMLTPHRVRVVSQGSLGQCWRLGWHEHCCPLQVECKDDSPAALSAESTHDWAWADRGSRKSFQVAVD